MRTVARHLRALGLALAARASGRRVGLVLVYHAVASETGDRRTQVIPPIGEEMLDRQVRHLLRRYDVVAPSKIRAAAEARRRGRRLPVALTFDDDLACHATVTAPLLERHGTTAAFFVSGASLDSPNRFWWEDLQAALDRGAVQEADLASVDPCLVEAAVEHADRAAARLAGAIEVLAPEEREEIGRTLRERAGPPPVDAGLRRDAIRRLAAAGFEIGFHTSRHDRLPDLDDAALRAALETGVPELEAVTGHPLTSISYPHGRADPRVADAARAAGFEHGFTGEARVVTPDDDPLLLPRIAPTFADVGAFAVQVARFASGRTRD